MIVIRVLLGIILMMAIVDCINQLEDGNPKNKFHIFCLVIYTLIEIILIRG